MDHASGFSKFFTENYESDLRNMQLPMTTINSPKQQNKSAV